MSNEFITLCYVISHLDLLETCGAFLNWTFCWRYYQESLPNIDPLLLAHVSHCMCISQDAGSTHLGPTSAFCSWLWNPQQARQWGVW